MIHHVSTWLKKKPNKSEIVEIQNGKDKVKIIPQKIIETLLDELTEQNWSTRNFQFSTRHEEQFTDATKPQRVRTMCDASLELVVIYRQMVTSPLHDDLAPVLIEKEITRVLVGAVSFDVAFYANLSGNDYVANTAKSLCITNAASDLGRRFGKDLNPNVLPPMKGLAPGANKISDTLSKIHKKQ